MRYSQIKIVIDSWQRWIFHIVFNLLRRNGNFRMFMTMYEKSTVKDSLRAFNDFREYSWFLEKENTSILELHFMFVNMSIIWKTVKILFSVSSWDTNFFSRKKTKRKCSNFFTFLLLRHSVQNIAKYKKKSLNNKHSNF